jgi:hypothetical protein
MSILGCFVSTYFRTRQTTTDFYYVCSAFGNILCVSSEAAFVMRAGLSMGEAEQPSPSNRLYAALL